jgi:hypothetical protein
MSDMIRSTRSPGTAVERAAAESGHCGRCDEQRYVGWFP